MSTVDEEESARLRLISAKAEIAAEDEEQRRRNDDPERRRIEAETSRRSSLPSEDREHIHGMMCDGQDGWNSYCDRLRRKLGFSS